MSIYINTECEEFNEFKNECNEITFDVSLILKTDEEKIINIYFKRFIKFLQILVHNFTDYDVEINEKVMTELPKTASELFKCLFAGLDTEDKIRIISIYKKPPGLMISNFLIKKISGPIEVSILKPNEKFFKEMKELYDINAPIFMLFGDYHPVSETLCNPCPKEDCLSIWDDSFYKLLDNIADPRYPIDINLEAFIFDKPFYADGHEKTIAKIIQIYNRCLKQNEESSRSLKGESLCPTKKLRYQYSDIRQTYQTSQKSSMINDVQFEYFYHVIKEFTEYYALCDDPIKIIKDFLVGALNNIKHKDDIFLFLDKMIGYYSKMDSSFYIEGIDDFPKSFLQKQYNKSPILREFFDNILKTYFDLFNNNSTQCKFNKIMVEYYSTLKEIITIILSFEDKLNSDDLNGFVEKLSKFKRLLSGISQIMSNNFNIFLDVYYLFRSFSKRSVKSTREESNPLLSFCYFGFCHVMHLTIYLVKSGYYDVVYKSFDDDEESIGYKLCKSKKYELLTELDHKCVEFNNRVNIDELYKHYISLSKSSSPSKEEPVIDGKRRSSKKSSSKRSRSKRKSSWQISSDGRKKRSKKRKRKKN